MSEDSIETRYLRGNTMLLAALMDMVDQFFETTEVNGEEILNHSFISAEENAIEVLIKAGYAEEVPGKGYRLLWDKLKERKKKYAID